MRKKGVRCSLHLTGRLKVNAKDKTTYQLGYPNAANWKWKKQCWMKINVQFVLVFQPLVSWPYSFANLRTLGWFFFLSWYFLSRPFFFFTKGTKILFKISSLFLSVLNRKSCSCTHCTLYYTLYLRNPSHYIIFYLSTRFNLFVSNP